MSVDVVSLFRNDPARNGGSMICKFMLLRHDGILNLIIGSLRDYPYHANLIDFYCRRHDLSSAWARKPDLMEIFDRSVTIRGGGWADLNRSHKTCTIYGASTAYGRFDTGELREVVGAHEFFVGLAVTVRG